MDYESKLVFDGRLIKIGSWRCGPDSALWNEENIAGSQPMLVFPRTSVQITQDAHEPFISTRNLLAYYNKNQTYRRKLVDRRGDICEYFYVDPRELENVLKWMGYEVSTNPEEPFKRSSGNCDTTSYSVQRYLFEMVANHPAADALFVEETFFSILPGLLEGANRPLQRNLAKRQSTANRQREHVESVKEYLVHHLEDHLSIKDVAEACDTSAFHLCRVFKQQTGLSIFKYLTKMRLLETIDIVLDTKRDLTDIALQFGFSSHSHMTESFRLEFGFPPSELRRSAPKSLIKKLKQQKQTVN